MVGVEGQVVAPGAVVAEVGQGGGRRMEAGGREGCPVAVVDAIPGVAASLWAVAAFSFLFDTRTPPLHQTPPSRHTNTQRPSGSIFFELCLRPPSHPPGGYSPSFFGAVTKII